MALTLIHGYYASVSYVDTQIGRLLKELDRLGLTENTIVILWGDHGWQLGEHGLWCKHCNFQTSLHAPLIVKAPGIQGGNKAEGLTEFVDIYPSLCELCGLPLPDHLEGTSFVPLLKKPDRHWKKAIFSRYHNGDSIRTERFLYTEWTEDDGEIYARMLYDHNWDPKENFNISELPENRKLVERLSKMLREGWRALRQETN
jgi:arylsulfatase A-like enzyme